MSSSKGNILGIWQHKSISKFVINYSGIRLHYVLNKRHRPIWITLQFSRCFQDLPYPVWLRDALMGVGTTVCTPSPSVSGLRRQMSWRSGNPTQFTSCQLLPESASLNGQSCLSKIKDKNFKHLISAEQTSLIMPSFL